MAINTMFQPKQNSSVCTYLQTAPQGGDAQGANDFGKYIGRKVKAKYKGKWISGAVTQAYTNKKGRMRWALKFQDGHSENCSEKRLKDMLIYVRKKQIGHQLDHVLVSNRWVSSVEDCKV